MSHNTVLWSVIARICTRHTTKQLGRPCIDVLVQHVISVLYNAGAFVVHVYIHIVTPVCERTGDTRIDTVMFGRGGHITSVMRSLSVCECESV